VLTRRKPEVDRCGPRFDSGRLHDAARATGRLDAGRMSPVAVRVAPLRTLTTLPPPGRSGPLVAR